MIATTSRPRPSRARATGRRRPPSTPRPSRCCRCRRRCAGRAARRRAAASDRRRAAARRNRAKSNSVREHVGPERGQALIEPGPPLGHQFEQRTVELDHFLIAGAEHDPRPPRGAAPPTAGPYTPHTPTIPRCECSTRSPSNRMNRCLPWVSTLRTARPSRRDPASGRARAAAAESGSRRGRAPRAPGACGWPRRQSCRPRARADSLAQTLMRSSVSRRGPSWNPSLTSAVAERASRAPTRRRPSRAPGA